MAIWLRRCEPRPEAEVSMVAFECAGHPASVRGCLEPLRLMGRHIQVAICGQDIRFPLDRVFYKQLTVAGRVLHGADVGPHVRDFCAAPDCLGDLGSRTLPITEWREAFDLVSNRRSLKVLMYPV